MDEKTTLHDYLRRGRDSLLLKVEGLSEYDVRRPLTPTGTNILGLVKHVASVQLDYFGVTFGRPADRAIPWLAEDAVPDSDMWVPAAESRAEIIEFHHYSAAHSDATIDALSIDAIGEVPWWKPGTRRVTLHQILVHVVAETARHAGHADILRESIDGEVGLRAADPNIPGRSAEEWAAYRAMIEADARRA
ncbi:DinB family protein [Agreia bicolorata]|nr:DinB family protein [Agreia bicolorata]